MNWDDYAAPYYKNWDQNFSPPLRKNWENQRWYSCDVAEESKENY